MKIFFKKLITSDLFLPITFFVLIFLVYPGMFLCVPGWNLLFFEAGTIVLMMGSLLLLQPSRITATLLRLPRELEFAVLLLFGIAAFHFFKNSETYIIQEKGLLFLTTILPFAACVYAVGFRRILTPALAFCWLHNVIFSLVQYCGLHWLLFGLPLNINWNAAYLAVTAPFAALWILRCRFISKTARYACAAIIGLLTAYLIFLTESRGCALAIVCVLFFIALRCTHGSRRLLVLECALGLTFIAIISYLLFAPDGTMQHILTHDERIYMMKQTLGVIADHPVLGCGGPSFENEFLQHRTAEFFTLAHSAIRVDHPHNHFLYIAASTGIIGLLLWLYILLRPISIAIRQFPQLSTELKLSLLCLMGLLIHGQFDLIMFRWPTALLAMVFLGLLWHECEDTQAPFWRPHFILRFLRMHVRRTITGSTSSSSRLLTVAFILCGIVAFIMSLYTALDNLYAEILSRKAAIAEEQGDMELAAKLHLHAVLRPESNLVLCNRALAFSSQHDPRIVEQYLSIFRESSTPEFGYLHDYAAFAYVLLRNYPKAEEELKRSIELRPYSVIPLLMLKDVYVFMGKPGAADAVEMRLMKIMELRKLSYDDLDIIMKQQELDLTTNFRCNPLFSADVDAKRNQP